MSDASFKTGVELREERLWALFLILLDLAFFVAVVAALAAQWMAWRMGFPEVLDGDLLPLHQLPLKPRVLHLVGLLMAAAAWPAFMVKKLGLRWASWHLFWMGLVAVLVARLGFMYDPRAVMRWMEVLSASEDWLWLAEEVRIGFGSLVAVGLMFRIWLAFERMKGLEGVGDHGSARYGTVKGTQEGRTNDQAEGANDLCRRDRRSTVVFGRTAARRHSCADGRWEDSGRDGAHTVDRDGGRVRL